MQSELKKMCPDCFQMVYGEQECSHCHYTKIPIKGEERALAAGTLLGNRYVIGRILGIGGFGITYKAYDTLHCDICAIKEYAPSDFTFREAGGKNIQIKTFAANGLSAHGMQRFIQEAQMLKSLEGIPEVVRVKECFKENMTAYFVMEFLDGINLKKLVQRMRKSISSKDITDMVIGIAEAMGAIHEAAGILHRDISPENIYVLNDGTVRILDFGSARQAVTGREQGFSVELKPGFAPLEQYSKNGKQGPYTDVYALACTYYYALTGLMIPAAVDRLDGKEYAPLNRLCPEISPFVSAGVDRALELDYRKRIQTMKEFADIFSEDKAYDRPLSPEKEKKVIPYLEVVTGNTAGNKWRLPFNTEILLGRSPVQSNIILTSDPLISNVHCKIIYNQNSGIFLLSDTSRNGTFVNNKRLEPEVFYELAPESLFSLAHEACVIKVGVFYE